MLSPTDKIWTEACESECFRLWHLGLTFAQIGHDIGKSRNAVAGKCHRAGLGRIQRAIVDVVKFDQSNKIATTKVKLTPQVVAPSRQSNVSLLDLDADGCKWPSGDRGCFTFCNKHRIKGSPYCKPHDQRAYNPSAPVKLSLTPSLPPSRRSRW